MSFKIQLPKSQTGASLIGVFFWGGLLAIAAFCGIKIAPVYFEHSVVKQSLASLSETKDIGFMSKPRVQDLFLRKLSVNSVKNVTPDQLEIEKTQGKVLLKLSYEVKVPMIANISAVVNFNEEVWVEE